MARVEMLFIAAAAVALWSDLASAEESVMVRCGREYQAARAAGTLQGADWNRYRVDCAARLKDGAGTTAAPGVAPIAKTGAVASPPAALPAAAAVPPSAPPAGMTAAHLRQKRCGAEWTAQKTVLVAQTPGLTWPRYWSLCNTRLKAAGT